MKRLLVLAILVCSATEALAQTSTLPDGSTLNFIRLYTHEGNSATLVQPITPPQSLWHYFNYAHCVCSQPGAIPESSFKETTFGYLVQDVGGGSTLTQPMQVWVGSMCDNTTDLTIRSTMCHQIMSAGASSIESIVPTGGITPEISVYDLMEPEPKPIVGCDQRVLAANEWVAVDTMMSGSLDYWANQEIDTDSQPPPTPTSITANGSENGISLSWTAPVGNVADILYYQALCSTDLGDPGLPSPSASPAYITPRTLCGISEDAMLVPCNFLDPMNPHTCAAAGTQTTTTDAGIDDAPDASSDFAGRRAPQAPPMDAPADAAPDAAIIDADDDTTPDASPFDAGTPINLAALAQLPAAYICGQAGTTDTSMQIMGLTNNVNYTVVLLAIDKSGNAAGVYINQPIMPKPVTDFWEDLHDKGSDVQGGFCLIAETYGDDNPLTNALRSFRDHTLETSAWGRWLADAYYATLGKLGAVVHGHWTLRILSGILLSPLVVLALLWHYLTLPGLLAIGLLLAFRRRVMRSRIAARAVATGAAGAVFGVVLLGAPARAHAQAPYWENQATGSDDDSTGFADVPTIVKWKVGVGIGPYTPAIDSQSTMKNSAGQGPYQAMFGGYSIMPKLDVDRFLWNRFGQLGVGLSVGYIGKSANAYVIPSDPSDPNRPRSPGDTTAFRLIPVQVTAIYRLSVLDDDYNIPIVPYVRAGVGYYIWWSTINGHLSSDPMDLSNKSDGASAGLVGAVGLSFRAERIDSAAARSMHESGIEHAGFFAELNSGWVDGFGKSTKLDVGDTTFFGGVEFEF